MTERQAYVVETAAKAYRDKDGVCEHGRVPACYSCQTYRNRILADETLPAMIALVYELAGKVPAVE